MVEYIRTLCEPPSCTSNHSSAHNTTVHIPYGYILSPNKVALSSYQPSLMPNDAYSLTRQADPCTLICTLVTVACCPQAQHRERLALVEAEHSKAVVAAQQEHKAQLKTLQVSTMRI